MSIKTLRAQVDKVLGEPVGDQDNLLDARLDSIRLMMLVEQRRANDERSLGMMAESFLQEGHQEITTTPLRYGVSVADACLAGTTPHGAWTPSQQLYGRSAALAEDVPAGQTSDL